MRLSSCLSVLLGILAILVVAVPAKAKIKPIPKPPTVAPKQKTAAARAVVAPIAKPAIHAKPVVHRKPVAHKKAVAHAKPAVHATRAVHGARTTSRAATHVRRHVIRLTHRHGGRKVAPAASWGGRRAPPPPLPVRPVVPNPTPLGLVDIRDALPAPDSTWPAWALSLLGGLALGEAVVLIQLVRGRRLSPSV